MRCSQTIAAATAVVMVILSAASTAGAKPAPAARKSLGAKTLAQPCPVWVIGSYDKMGKPNVMTASWAAICCSQPPCVTVSLRKATHTYGNIMESGAFTVNIPSEAFTREAAYFGSVSGRDVDKFAATGLTAVHGDSVNAPYVNEFPLVLECRLIKTVELGLHTMFIGEIRDVKADESILNEQGRPDIMKLKPFLFVPGDPDFYGIGTSLGGISDLAKELVPRR
jgi:flavin reductase (DIM6/NTAB) family NADH-FMN oxidoreductase RutF